MQFEKDKSNSFGSEAEHPELSFGRKSRREDDAELDKTEKYEPDSGLARGGASLFAPPAARERGPHVGFNPKVSTIEEEDSGCSSHEPRVLGNPGLTPAAALPFMKRDPTDDDKGPMSSAQRSRMNKVVDKIFTGQPLNSDDLRDWSHDDLMHLSQAMRPPAESTPYPRSGADWDQIKHHVYQSEEEEEDWDTELQHIHLMVGLGLSCHTLHPLIGESVTLVPVFLCGVLRERGLRIVIQLTHMGKILSVWWTASSITRFVVAECWLLQVR